MVVVGGQEADRAAVVAALATRGLSVAQLGSLAALRRAQPTPELVILVAPQPIDLDEWVLLRGSVPKLSAVAFVVVAASKSELDAVRSLQLGAADFVPAEATPAELAARVETRLQRLSCEEEMGRYQRGMELVLELTHTLASALETHELLRMVVKRIAEVIDVERASIVLKGSQETAYVVAASDDDTLEDFPIKLDSYPEIRQVLDTAQPFQTEAPSSHPLFELARVSIPERFRALTVFPIVFEEEPLGVFFLRFSTPRALDTRESFLIRAIANATGIALRHAGLVTTLRNQSQVSESARLEAQQELSTLHRYVDFFNSSADGILVLNRAGKVLFCNPAACHATGRSPDDLVGTGLDTFLSADGRRRFNDIRSGFAGGRFPGGVDLAIHDDDDNRRILNVSFSAMLNERDGLIVSMRNVTEERAIARELNKTKEFLQRVINSSVDAIISADMGGRILLFNPAAEKTCGYRADEVVSKMSVRDLYLSGTAEVIMRQIRSAEHGPAGTLEGFEAELVAKDGTRIPVELSAALIVHRGRAIGSVGVFKDLRARMQIEERLIKTQQELADQEQKAFIADLAGATAHELNQPLTTVMGYAGLLSRGISEDQPQLFRAAGAIARETERMAEIVRKIGKLTKYETKRYVGETTIIDIERSIEDSQGGEHD